MNIAILNATTLFENMHAADAGVWPMVILAMSLTGTGLYFRWEHYLKWFTMLSYEE